MDHEKQIDIMNVFFESHMAEKNGRKRDKSGNYLVYHDDGKNTLYRKPALSGSEVIDGQLVCVFDLKILGKGHKFYKAVIAAYLPESMRSGCTIGGNVYEPSFSNPDLLVYKMSLINSENIPQLDSQAA